MSNPIGRFVQWLGFEHPKDDIYERSRMQDILHELRRINRRLDHVDHQLDFLFDVVGLRPRIPVISFAVKLISKPGEPMKYQAVPNWADNTHVADATHTLPAAWPPTGVVTSGDGILTSDGAGNYVLDSNTMADVLTFSLAGFPDVVIDVSAPPIAFTGFGIQAIS